MTYQTTIVANSRDVACGSAETESESIKKAIKMFESLCQTDPELKKNGISLMRTVEVTQ